MNEDKKISNSNKSSKNTGALKTSDLQEAFKKLLGEEQKRPDKNQARVDALVGVASIDIALQKMLSKALSPALDENDELISEKGPIGTLMWRAKLACRMGLISFDMYSVVKDLSKIRNISAHEEQKINIFDKDEVKQRITNIWDRLDKDFKDDTQETFEEKFNLICLLVKISVQLKTRQLKAVSFCNKEVIFTQ